MSDYYFPIETERLILRRVSLEDVDAMFAYASRPDVARYMLWEPLTREQTEARLTKWIENEGIGAEGNNLSCAIILRSSGSMIGDCGLMTRDVEARQGEIGYTVHPDFQGHGYATEAVSEILRVGFTLGGLHRIYARCDGRNNGSWKLMERLGMRREAHFREHALFKGEWDDELYYAILEDEWRDQHGMKD